MGKVGAGMENYENKELLTIEFFFFLKYKCSKV